MKSVYDYQSLSTLTSEEKIAAVAKTIHSMTSLDERRKLAVLFLYLMALHKIPSNHRAFKEINELIQSSRMDKLAKGLKSRFGKKDKGTETSIQKLFRRYDPNTTDINELVRRLETIGINVAEDLEEKPIEITSATASADEAVKPLETKKISDESVVVDDSPIVKEPQVVLKENTSLEGDRPQIPPAPTAVAGVPRRPSPQEAPRPPAPPGGIAGAPRPPAPPGGIAGAPRPPAPPGGIAGVPRPPAPPASASSLDEKAGPLNDLQSQMAKLRKVEAAPSVAKPEPKANPMLDELQRRLKGRGEGTREHVVEATAPERKVDEPSVVKTQRAPRAVKPSMDIPVGPPKVSFFQQAQGVKLRPTSAPEPKGSEASAAPSELETRLQKRREAEEKSTENESKKSP